MGFYLFSITLKVINDNTLTLTPLFNLKLTNYILKIKLKNQP